MRPTDQSIEAPTRVGRPRRIQPSTDADPFEEILASAAGLFTELGYAGTSTRQIAAAAGLQQGSIFHHFPRKADILSELLDRTLEPAVSFARRLQAFDAPVDERFALLAYRDAFVICSGPYNLGALMHMREVRAGEFAPFWEKRDALRAVYEELVGEGIAAGLFLASDVKVATDLAFGLVESCIHWFERGAQDPAEAADHVAVGVMRLVLRRPHRARGLVTKALEGIGSDPELDHVDFKALPEHNGSTTNGAQ
jgi:AcrR family transcriptional regulator